VRIEHFMPKVVGITKEIVLKNLPVCSFHVSRFNVCAAKFGNFYKPVW
jgi:hypothetical protein